MDVAPAPPVNSGGDQKVQQTPISPHPNHPNQAPAANAKATTIENGVQTGGAKKPESCGEKAPGLRICLCNLSSLPKCLTVVLARRTDTFHWDGPEGEGRGQAQNRAG